MGFTFHIPSQYYKPLQINKKMLKKKSSKSIQVPEATEELNFSSKSAKEICLSVSNQQFWFVVLIRFLDEDPEGSCYVLLNILVCRFNNTGALRYNYHTNNLEISVTSAGKKENFKMYLIIHS